ncbi:MAG: class I SAM-dependent methyltransferase [Candidatus Aenigmatarchaeota archaeon]
MKYKQTYFLARKRIRKEELKRSKKFNTLVNKFLSELWYSFFLYSLFNLYKTNPKKNPILLKFDVWEESSVRLSKIRHLPFLIKKIFKPGKIFFIDIDRKLIKLARKNIGYFGFNNAVFVNKSITKMPFQNNLFDFIIDFSTTDHLNKHELEQAIKEIHRVLKKDGTVIIYHMNSDYFNIRKFNYHYKKELFPSYPRKLKTLKRLLRDKFQLVESKYCLPFFADSTLFLHYRFLYNKIYKIMPRQFIFSFFNSPKLNLFFYIIAKKL